MSRLLTIALLLVGAVALPHPVIACSCVESGPPCQDYWAADAVFVGRVMSVETSANPERQFSRDRRVTFEVSEAFRGLDAGSTVVYTGQGRGDCGYRFTPGQSYVVYARRGDGGVLTTSICSRTTALAKAGDDVVYAKAIADGLAVDGGVRGLVRFQRRTLGQDRPSPAVGMPNATIVVSGSNGGGRATSDETGRFSLTGLLAGRYSVALDLPAQYFARLWPDSVELPDPRACASVSALVAFDGHVSGRVVDAEGQPIPGLTLDLLSPEELKRPTYDHRRILTGDDGRYEFAEIPPGRFLVAVNPVRPQRSSPGPTVYYPGVAGSAAAATRVLGAGDHLDLGDFTLPRTVAFTQVHGVVTGPDGAPAAGAKVYLKLAGEEGSTLSEPARSRSDGTFLLSAALGAEYQVFAEQSVDEDGRRRLLTSEPETFTAASGLSAVTLRLRSPF